MTPSAQRTQHSMEKANDISETCASSLLEPLRHTPRGQRGGGRGWVAAAQVNPTASGSGQAQPVGPAFGGADVTSTSLPGLLSLSGGITIQVETPAPQGPAALKFTFLQHDENSSLEKGGSPCPCTCTKPSSKQRQGRRRACQRLLLPHRAQDCVGE